MRDGLVRQGAFNGLRGDNPAREVVREQEMPTKKAGFPDQFEKVPIREKSGKQGYLYITDVQGLIASV